MSFFNKKEEVISIELTPYGRHLLSLGKLKPSHYAFFDDDVIYNIQAAGGTESSAQIKGRILSETPYLKPNYLFENLNDNVAVNFDYTLKIKNQNKQSNTTGVNFVKPEFRSTIFADGTYIDIEFEKMIVQLLEENAFNLTDSFDIEVFKQDAATIVRYDQLKFLPKQRKVVDGFLVDDEVMPIIDPTPEYVEYYFDLLVKDIFVDIDIECPDLQGQDVNIYTSRINPSDIEVCD